MSENKPSQPRKVIAGDDASAWLGEQLERLERLPADAPSKQHAKEVLTTIAYGWRSERNDAVPLVKQDGSNATDVANAKVAARTRALLTEPPAIEFFHKGEFGGLVIKAGDDQRGVAIQVGDVPLVHYRKQDAGGGCGGCCEPANSALQNLFRWIATGEQSWK